MTDRYELTQGPWVEDQGWICGTRFDGPVDYQTNLFAIHSASRPDIKLVLAAPEMLAALKNIENDDEHMPKTAWAMIQAAIAKAEKSDD